ncbi:hypothetical protein HHI36_002896, partial [Cryptolaemus montrouzieri]
VPDQKDDTKKVITEILDVLKVPHENDEIKEVFRIGKKQEAPIILKLNNKELKNKIIKAVKTIKGVKVRECELEGKNNNIFFIDELTTSNLNLLRKTKELAKGKGYHSAYYLHGKVYIKTCKDNPPTRIFSEEDLKTKWNNSQPK